jgi:ABC-type Zn uptake system ZnuABC Zn-binding protein ZnuA
LPSPSAFSRISTLRTAILWLSITLAASVFAGGCADSEKSSDSSSTEASANEHTVVATVPPLGMILSALTRGRASVEVLLAPGASPHTYEPTPSDVRMVSSSLLLVHANEHLDGWVASLPAERTLELAPLIPSSRQLMMPSPDGGEKERHRSKHASGTIRHGNLDPHFWTSPPVVQSIVPSLVDSLCAADAGGCPTYRKNGNAMMTDLEVLHRQILSMLRPVKGATVTLSQPFFQYFLNEYGFPIAAVIEPHPGKEPSPQRIRELIETVQQEGAVVIFTQTQLPGRSARVISSETAIPTRDLDPLGGTEGRATYAEFMIYNAQEVLAALQSSRASEPASGSLR